ncbi:MAG: hypothetical protein LLG00_11620 [Planctomycetaceae bacterium]|nr:hypothetical protein [Planctomycetaceae bacterium]
MEQHIYYAGIGIAILLVVAPRVLPLVSAWLAARKTAPARDAAPDANTIAAAYQLIERALDDATSKAVRAQLAEWLLGSQIATAQPEEPHAPPTN